jgi:hypothetical protein
MGRDGSRRMAGGGVMPGFSMKHTICYVAKNVGTFGDSSDPCSLVPNRVTRARRFESGQPEIFGGKQSFAPSMALVFGP